MEDPIGIGALERQVIDAALVTVRPSSSTQQRSEASASLERWTTGGGGAPVSAVDAGCWEAYINIIRILFGAHRSDAPSAHSPRSPSSGFPHVIAGTDVVERIADAASPGRPGHVVQEEASGAKLLLMTLLCGKVRREYIRLLREHAQLARLVFDELWLALVLVAHADPSREGRDPFRPDAWMAWKPMAWACCSAVAAAAVRASSPQRMNEGIMNATHECKASVAASLGIGIAAGDDGGISGCHAAIPSLSPAAALRLLAEIPGEARSRTDMTTVGIDALLQMPHSDVAMETLQMALGGYLAGGEGERYDVLLSMALGALSKWGQACKKFTLSNLLESTVGGSPSFLLQLVALLSSQSQQRRWCSELRAEEALTNAASAMCACIENTSDYGTQSRRSAVTSLLASVAAPTEFLVQPLKSAHSEGVAIALSNLASTLAREEIEEISTCRLPGCSDLIGLLLELQAHPVHHVAIPVLEVWLALQDVPTSDRHPTLAAPLYQQLTEVILNRVAYPSTFVSWEEELELDASDFNEMRNLSADVLVGAYYMLRSGYLETLANVVMAIDGHGWEVRESALFCMCAVGREACARVKSVRNAAGSGRDSPVAADGEATSMGLARVVGSVCAGGAQGVSRRHPLVLNGIAKFLGSYSTVWAASCPPQSIVEILAYLSAAISVPASTEASGRSIRLVLIASAGKLARAAASPGADLSTTLSKCMEAALSRNNANACRCVAEGCARVSVTIRNKAKSRATLSAVAAPTILRARSALDAIISLSTIQHSGQATGQVDAACQGLASYLGILRELIKFCDCSSIGQGGESHVLSDVLTAAWPVLNDISSQTSCRTNEAVLSGLLDVQSQLLSVVPSLIGPHFEDLITFVVKAYEESFCPSALDYVSAAVETFDTDKSIGAAAGLDEPGKEMIFNQLLSHLCQCTFTYATSIQHPRECPQLIKSLFEMAQRYLLFCPGALCRCPQFASLFAVGAACLTECQGEVESTRATLIFLTQLIGWKHIRLQESKMSKLVQFEGAISNLLLQHGEQITKSCLSSLSGAAPQILWPSYSECLFSVMLHIISTNPSADEPNSVLTGWLQSAMADSSLTRNTQNITPELGTDVIKILCHLAKEGTKSKQKAKMALMDFGKIAKGEATADALLAYSIA